MSYHIKGYQDVVCMTFSVQSLSWVRLCDPMNRSMPGLPVHHQLPEFTQTQRLSSQWCHPAISSSVVPFSCPDLSQHQSLPMSQLFAWGGQSIGVFASASVLPMNTQDWPPLGWTGWISLQSNTTVQKHQFFGAQLSSQSKSQMTFLHRSTLKCWPLSQLFHSPLSLSSRGSLVPLHFLP